MSTAVQTLHTAIALREDARAKLIAATEATKRARSTAEAAQGEVARLQAEEKKAVERHAHQLEERARSGKDGPGPVLVPSDRDFIARRTADSTLAAACQAVATLEADEHPLRKALAAAERGVQGAKVALRRIDVEAIAQRLQELRAEIWEQKGKLAAIDQDEPESLTPNAIEALQDSSRSPTVETFIGGYVVTDVHSPRGGHPALGRGRAYWRQRDEDYLAESNPAPTAQAAVA